MAKLDEKLDKSINLLAELLKKYGYDDKADKFKIALARKIQESPEFEVFVNEVANGGLSIKEMLAFMVLMVVIS